MKRVLNFGAALALTVVAAGMAPTSASAETVDLNCDTANFTTSKGCISPIPGGSGGNVKEDEMNTFTANGVVGAFGFTNWEKLGKIDLGQSGEDTTLESAPAPFAFSITVGDDGRLTGSWSLNPLFTWGDGEYAFAIKGSTDNAVYWMDTAFTSGTYTTAELSSGGSQQPGLSNITLFGTEGLAPIPLPASVLMILGALGAMAGVSWSRRRTTA